ncbi:MAG: hypothetical protein LC620_08550 [Halobacteriales archaeon]|nr:hypothetical protein [Halobacteriales archaeon]
MTELRTKGSNSPISQTRQSSKGSPTQVLRPGFISHTEFASRDPAATRAFCEKVFGWQFEVQDGPTGDHHSFRFEGDGVSSNTGGGIRALGKAEPPLAIPYVEVEDLRQSESAAVKAGARVVSPRVSMGDGSIVVLQVPGGPNLGLWAPNR